jgi:hypothetical protein
LNDAFDPILIESDKLPAIQAGTVVVVAEGGQLRLFTDETDLSRWRQPPEVLAPPAADQPIFEQTSPVVRKLSIFTRRAADVGARLASAGAKQAVRALKQTDVGARLLWSGERYFLVYIGRKTGEIGFEADSASSGISFRMTVSFEARVIDAVEAVAQGIRDLCGHHANTIRARAREAARQYSAQELDAARNAVSKAFAQGVRDLAVEVCGVSARITVDQRAVDLLRTVSEEDLRIQAINAQSRTQRAQRDNELQDLRSPEKVLAAWLSTHDERYRKIYEGMITAQSRNRDEKTQLLKLAIEKGLIEPHDVWSRFPDFADSVLSVVGNALPTITANSSPSSQEN